MLEGAEHHTVLLDDTGVGDGRSVVAFFARQLMKDLRLVGGYDTVVAQVKAFIRQRLFAGGPVDIDDPVVLRNLSESVAAERMLGSFKAAINALTVQDSGKARMEDHLHLRDVRPFRTQHRDWLPAQRCIFNRIVGEPHAGGLAGWRAGAAFCQFSGQRRRRGRLCQKLPGRRRQARLRQGQR